MARKNGVFNETAQLVDNLGVKRGELAAKLGLDRASINAWVVRNHIPWKYRSQVFLLAREAKIDLPDGFLGV